MPGVAGVVGYSDRSRQGLGCCESSLVNPVHILHWAAERICRSLT